MNIDMQIWYRLVERERQRQIQHLSYMWFVLAGVSSVLPFNERESGSAKWCLSKWHFSNTKALALGEERGGERMGAKGKLWRSHAERCVNVFPIQHRECEVIRRDMRRGYTQQRHQHSPCVIETTRKDTNPAGEQRVSSIGMKDGDGELRFCFVAARRRDTLEGGWMHCWGFVSSDEVSIRGVAHHAKCISRSRVFVIRKKDHQTMEDRKTHTHTHTQRENV